MGIKRKRSRVRQNEDANKRLKLREKETSDEDVKHSLLSQYYREVMTLREYLLSKLPLLSKVRRKKIATIGSTDKRIKEKQAESKDCCAEEFLAHYLDSTLVGVLEPGPCWRDERLKDWTCFSQLADKTDSGIGDTVGDGGYAQSEIVDFSIWSLFTKGNRCGSRVQHLLCQGYRKVISSHSVNNGINPTSSIPGVVSTYPNHLVTTMKSTPWPQILKLLGKEGETVMIDLLLDCGIFPSVESGCGNYFQLSGKPLGDLQSMKSIAFGSTTVDRVEAIRRVVTQSTKKTQSKPLAGNFEQAATIQRQILHPKNSPGAITFVRNRLLYARATLNAKGALRFGLRHNHVLNRFPYQNSTTESRPAKTDASEDIESENKRRAVHIMMYIFPREFGLHNVFTSTVDSRDTVQPLKDYTLREDEIRSKFVAKTKRNLVPKRLRGEAQYLIKKLQINHGRCPYSEILRHYCPVFTGQKGNLISSQPSLLIDSTAFQSQDVASCQSMSTTVYQTSAAVIPPRNESLMDRATPAAEVSAFCRAVMLKLIPDQFWGTGEAQRHNKSIFLRNVDKFIMMRRFESLSLHEAVQGIKLQNLSWLAPCNDVPAKMSQTDHQKRLQLLTEFIYYLFDSILIPLIRTNFHVTESSGNRSQLFFFRHDVWRSLSEPALASLKTKMFEEMDTEQAQKVFDSRGFGFSHIRLLPKETGVRPIMNLKRRAVKKGFKTALGPSINSVLGPVFNMLTFEGKIEPRRLGSALFSVGDLYQKLKQFKMRIPKEKQLYFVKADVQAAFDTIPQSAVMRLMSELPRESEYRISKHVEFKPGVGKPIKKWSSIAVPPGDFHTFDQKLETELAIGKKNTVFVESVVGQFKSKDELLSILAEHIQCNMVKIGKKYFRQREGIPQGSVVSSLLCNYFYADLELKHLSFLTEESLLLRLIDDFLLITMNQQHARRFLGIMHDGFPEYGVTVNPSKTLTNFEVSLSGKKATRLVGSRNFPYCGSFIDTKSLNITKDRKEVVADSLTVEFSRAPGKAFHRKVLSTFKIQAHAMFLDTSLNSVATVLSNLFESFKETATKMWKYLKCLPLQKQPGAKLIIRTIEGSVDLAAVLLKSKKRRNEGYKCAVSKLQIEWLAMMAFWTVLRRRQSKYREVVVWLEGRIELMKSKNAIECMEMMRFGNEERIS